MSQRPSYRWMQSCLAMLYDKVDDERAKAMLLDSDQRAAVYGGLVSRGFRPLSRVGDILFGGVHAVYVAPDGRRIGAADPRRDGFAVAQ